MVVWRIERFEGLTGRREEESKPAPLKITRDAAPQQEKTNSKSSQRVKGRPPAETRALKTDPNVGLSALV